MEVINCPEKTLAVGGRAILSWPSLLMIQRLLLCVLLAILILYSFTGEIIPYNNGLGWDGSRYYYYMANFEDLIVNQGIDSYRITRLLPFLLIRYVMQSVNVEITVNNVLIASKIFNAFILAILLIYFFKLSNVAKWNRFAEIIAFSFTFFNFPVLKFFGYYPLLTDCTALLLSFMAVYYFFIKSYIGMAFVTLLSLVTWPILSIITYVLAVFPRDRVEEIDTKSLFQRAISLFVRVLFVSFIPLVLSFSILRLHMDSPELDVYHNVYKYRLPINFFWVLLATVSVCSFYYFATKNLKINWDIFFRAFLKVTVLTRMVICGFLLAILYKGISNLGGKAPWSSSLQILNMSSFPTTDVLIFLETHFLYLGLFFVLIVLRWHKIIDYVKNYLGIGYFVVVLFALFFIVDIETRKLTSFYPILLMPLMAVIKDIKFKKWVYYLIPICCLFCSFFWFNINTPDIVDAFNQTSTIYNIDSPAQRYFMFMGPWQSRTVYLIVSMVELTLLFVIYLLHKRGMLYEE